MRIQEALPTRVRIAPWPGGLYGGAGAGAAPVEAPAWTLDGDFGLNWLTNESWDGIELGTASDYVECSRGSGKWLRFAAAPYYRWIEVDELPLSDLGLNIEDQQTNLVLKSRDFTDVTYWGQSNIGVPTKDQTGPDGIANSACLVTENTATARHGINEVAGNPVAMTNGITYLSAVIVKAGTCGIIQLTYPLSRMGGGGYANFDLTNGVAGSTGGTVAASGMLAIGGGWYRCWLAAACTNSGTGNININLCTATNNTRNFSYLGTSRNFTIWACDLVAGTTGISSPIETELAAATRMADVITLLGDAETASIASKAAFVQTNLARQNGRFVNFNDIRRLESASSTTARTSNGTNTATATTGSGTFSTARQKCAHGYDASGMSCVINAGSVVTNANPWGTPVAPVTLGSDTTGATNIRGLLELVIFSNTKDKFNGDTTP
jgi:hypothetical protein